MFTEQAIKDLETKLSEDKKWYRNLKQQKKA
jgi:hypothetical protein